MRSIYMTSFFCLICEALSLANLYSGLLLPYTIVRKLYQQSIVFEKHNKFTPSTSWFNLRRDHFLDADDKIVPLFIKSLNISAESTIKISVPILQPQFNPTDQHQSIISFFSSPWAHLYWEFCRVCISVIMTPTAPSFSAVHFSQWPANCRNAAPLNDIKCVAALRTIKCKTMGQFRYIKVDLSPLSYWEQS